MKLALPMLLLTTACAVQPAPNDQVASCVRGFTTSSIDTAAWNVFQQPGTQIAQQDGRLVVTPPTNMTGYATLFGVDVGAVAASVELGVVPSVPGVEALFQLASDDQHRHFITVEAGRIHFGVQNGDANESSDIAFDPAVIRHVRIAGDGDNAVYETSSDGASWEPQREVSLAFSLDDAYVELGGGAYQPVASPGVASFRNVVVEGACAAP